MIATEKARLRTTYYLSDLDHTFAVNITRGMPTIERTAIDFNLAHHDSFGYWESAAPDETYSLIPHGWTEEPFELVEPFTDQELWESEGCPTHVMVGGIDVTRIRSEYLYDESYDGDELPEHAYYTVRLDGYPCEVDGSELPESIPHDEPGEHVRIVGNLLARPTVRSEIADSTVLAGYALCTFDEFPDLTPDDREDIRQDLAMSLCISAHRAILAGRTPRIRRDLLEAARNRLVARKRKESANLPCVGFADENAVAEAREALETARQAKQANAWRLHLIEMERLRQQTQTADSGMRLI